MASECKSCENLVDHIKEEMFHIEELRSEIEQLEQYIRNLQINFEKIQTENEILKTQLEEKETEAEESQRLLDVIHKDRDECIEEKMKVSRFYRNEIKKVIEENEALRKENNNLKDTYNNENIAKIGKNLDKLQEVKTDICKNKIKLKEVDSITTNASVTIKNQKIELCEMEKNEDELFETFEYIEIDQ